MYKIRRKFLAKDLELKDAVEKTLTKGYRDGDGG